MKTDMEAKNDHIPDGYVHVEDYNEPAATPGNHRGVALKMRGMLRNLPKFFFEVEVKCPAPLRCRALRVPNKTY